MKKSFAKISFLFACLCGFVLAASSQEEPQPVEFARINVNFNETEIEEFTETIEKFIARLEQEPLSTKGYIDTPANTGLGKKIKSFIEKNSLLSNRIAFWGNLIRPESYRRTLELSFFLIPQGAKTPDRCILEPIFCPTIRIDALTNTDNQTKILTFTAKAEGGDEVSKITYRWTVSAGKIIAGQGTSTIKVDAASAKEITASAEIGGFAPDCPNTDSFTIKIQQ